MTKIIYLTHKITADGENYNSSTEDVGGNNLNDNKKDNAGDSFFT